MIGITINGKHSYRDFNLTIAEEGRDIGYPSKVKRKFKPPFSNVEYDFSSVYGDQDYTNRKLKYNFNVFSKENPTKNKMTWEKIAAQNWLYNTNGKIRIEDDLIEGYYFIGELEDGASFDEMWQSGVLTVEFECYPFMKDELPEGNNLWKTFNFHTDILQKTKFEVQRTTFKPVSVGNLVTVGAWSTAYEGGEKIPKDPLGNSYLIKEVKSTDQSVSKVAYMLEGLGKWVIEQDIVQAQNGTVEINLVNLGVPNAVPKITSDYPVSIIFGKYVFNIWKGVGISELFRLNSGDNKMQITGNQLTTVEFEFYKELI